MDEPHLEGLRNARAAHCIQAAAHHDREDHGRCGADAVLGVLLQLAGRVQHVGKVWQHVALGQAGAKQQDA